MLPICWQPLVELFNKYVDRIHQMDKGAPVEITVLELRDIAIEFSAEKNRILSRFHLLTAFREEIYTSIGNALDALEDEISVYCGTIDQDSEPSSVVIEYVASIFWSNLKLICEEMMKLHPHGKIPI